MAKAKTEITIYHNVDIIAVYRYYLLQSSTANPPSKPTTNPPSSSWKLVEPSYTPGSTNSLYTVERTDFSNGTFSYSNVSLSSSYEAAKLAYNKSVEAQNSANSANDKVDNLEIGGRNLLKFTDYSTLDGVFNRGTYHSLAIDSTNKYNNRNSLKVVCNTISVSGTNDVWQYLYNSIQSADSVVLSFYIKGSVEGRMWARIGGRAVASGNNQIPITTKWQKVSIVLENFNVSDATSTSEIIYGFYQTGTYWINSMKLEYGNKATDWTPAPEDTENEITENVVDIYQSISDQRTDIISETTELILKAATDYVGVGDYESFKQTVESQLKILSDSVSINFTTTSNAINDLSSSTNDEFTIIKKYFNFEEDGLKIGSDESAIKLRLDNEDGIIFENNGEQFGYWDGNNFYTGNIVVRVNERAQFGNYAYVPRSDGSLMFLKVK